MKIENQLEMLALPAASGATATAVSLSLPEQTTIEQWSETGNMLYKAGQKMIWWMADWAAFGERKFGQLKEFCEINEIDYGTIRNYASTSQRIQLSRRRDNLSFKHHTEVAALKPNAQTKFLKIAADENLSCSQLRIRIREWQGEFGPEKVTGPAPLLEIEKAFLDTWALMEKQSITLSESRDYLWEKAQPMLERAARVWPERVSLK